MYGLLPPHKLVICSLKCFFVQKMGEKKEIMKDQIIKQCNISYFVGYASAVKEHLRTLTSAVYDLVKVYLCSFCMAFPVYVDEEHPEKLRDYEEASSITEHVHFMLFALHGISAAWASR